MVFIKMQEHNVCLWFGESLEDSVQYRTFQQNSLKWSINGASQNQIQSQAMAACCSQDTLFGQKQPYVFSTSVD